MLFSIIWTIFSSIWKVYYKKTTLYNIPPFVNDLIWHHVAILWLIFFIIIWEINLFAINLISYLYILFICLIFITVVKLDYYSFKNEKISNLIPFDKLWSIITILLWVIFLWERISIIATLCIFFIFLIFIIWNISNNKIVISKWVITYIISNILTWAANFFTWMLLINISSLDFFWWYTLISIILLFIYLLVNYNIKSIFNNDKRYNWYRFLASASWISWIISIYLISNLWLVLSNLISFIWVFITLLLSFFIYKDKPSMKNIIITITITTLVVIWFIYK